MALTIFAVRHAQQRQGRIWKVSSTSAEAACAESDALWRILVVHSAEAGCRSPSLASSDGCATGDNHQGVRVSFGCWHAPSRSLLELDLLCQPVHTQQTVAGTRSIPVPMMEPTRVPLTL